MKRYRVYISQKYEFAPHSISITKFTLEAGYGLWVLNSAIKYTPQTRDSPLLDILIKNITDKSSLAFREYGELKHNHFDHGTVVRHMDISTVVQRTNHF